MRINNNIMAMNTHRQYGIANNSVAGSAEKLSSGYRINRAGDDAAGLAISEKMRAQIRGLNMASKNSQDAISLVQTAEGALQETHNILQRMRELAVQSSSDTNEKTIDRGALDAEFQQLKAEIDDIAGKTRFNDQNLIDGTFASYAFSVAANDTSANVILGQAVSGTFALTTSVRLEGAVTGSQVTFGFSQGSSAITNATYAAAGDRAGLGAANTAALNKSFTLQYEGAGATAAEGKFKLVAQDGTSFTGTMTAIAGTTQTITFSGLGKITFTTPTVTVPTTAATQETLFSSYTGMQLTGTGGTPDVAATTHAYLNLGGEEVEVFAGDTQVDFKTAGVTLTFAALTQSDVTTLATNDAEAVNTLLNLGGDAGEIEIEQAKGDSLVIQTGANQNDNLGINVEKMNTATLGIYSASISTREKADQAITSVNTAVNRVSSQRAALGALQNRLTHKIANLDTSSENLSAAESRIRDIDMAKEMTEFTKKNILVQAATAMLAQANSAPQNVLSLLQ